MSMNQTLLIESLLAHFKGASLREVCAVVWEQYNIFVTNPVLILS